MPRAVRIIKIDPEKRLIVQLAMVPSIKGIQMLIRGTANTVGWRKLVDDIHGEHLLCASRTDVDPDKPMKEWRLRGGENTAGVGVLFGTLNKALDGMWHCPVTVAWVERTIVWCEPGENASAAEENAGLEADPEHDRLAAADRAMAEIMKGGSDGPGEGK